mmetsp:Transcript_36140/g.71127  ORF Transcript_36140/g.71127 Transcript_36140/m.71127 type:complete len:90 (+) Transcript_36140:849-1118(+)
MIQLAADMWTIFRDVIERITFLTTSSSARNMTDLIYRTVNRATIVLDTSAIEAGKVHSAISLIYFLIVMFSILHYYEKAELDFYLSTFT